MTSPILIARILGPHGLRGQVKLKSLSEDITRYKSLRTLDGRVFEIAKIVPAKEHLIVTFKGTTDRNASEALKGTELYITPDQLPPSTDDIYLATLVGRDVMSGDKVLGRISGYQDFGAGELMELDTGLLIPVLFLDPATMAVALPDGFLETE